MQQRRTKIRYFLIVGLVILSVVSISYQAQVGKIFRRVGKAQELLYIGDNWNRSLLDMPDITSVQELLPITEMVEGEVDPPGSDPPEEEVGFEHAGELVIWAVNPGYKVNDRSDSGELIEIRNLSGESVVLTGFSLRYTNSSGNTVTLIEFPDESEMIGKSLTLRYSKSPDKDDSDLVYTTSLAMSAGPLELWQDDQKIDSVCWTGKTGCAKAFKSASPTTLVRDSETGEFVHLVEYALQFDPLNPGIRLPISSGGGDDDVAEKPTPRCRSLEFTEVYSYYVDDKVEQFIELYNPSDQSVEISKCQLKYKKKTYDLTGVIAPDSYFAYYPNGKFTLTKNPGTSNVVELIDADGQVVDELTYLHGQKKSTSYAKFYDASGAEVWSHTYARTPNQANVYQEFRSCESGKVINPETGNCVKADTVTDANGACPAGKYRNPLTGRCKKIETETTKECAEGYERNPETKRCRKIKTANTGADYTLVPITRSDSKVFIAAGVVAVIVSLGILYIVWQFRREIVRTFRKTHQRIHDIRKNFIARRSSRDRDEKP